MPANNYNVPVKIFSCENQIEKNDDEISAPPVRKSANPSTFLSNPWRVEVLIQEDMFPPKIIHPGRKVTI